MATHQKTPEKAWTKSMLEGLYDIQSKAEGEWLAKITATIETLEANPDVCDVLNQIAAEKSASRRD